MSHPGIPFTCDSPLAGGTLEVMAAPQDPAPPVWHIWTAVVNECEERQLWLAAATGEVVSL